MSILCGHCKQRHDTVAAVRMCSTLVSPQESSMEEEEPYFHDDNWPKRTVDPNYLREGFYEMDQELYQIVKSKSSSHLYAKVLVGTQSGHRWEYAPGAVKKLAEHSTRLGEEEVVQYGQDSGVCLVCGRTLTNPASIEAGIGPICAERF